MLCWIFDVFSRLKRKTLLRSCRALISMWNLLSFFFLSIIFCKLNQSMVKWEKEESYGERIDVCTNFVMTWKLRTDVIGQTTTLHYYWDLIHSFVRSHRIASLKLCHNNVQFNWKRTFTENANDEMNQHTTVNSRDRKPTEKHEIELFFHFQLTCYKYHPAKCWTLHFQSENTVDLFWKWEFCALRNALK